MARMLARRMGWLGVAVVVALWANVAVAAGGSPKAARPRVTTGKDFQAILSGRVVPLTMKMKDFDASWMRFVPGGAETGLMAQIYGPMMGGATAAYTRGDTVVLAGETFLIAYRPEIKQQGLYAMVVGRAAGEEEEGLSGETTARLSLLSVRNLVGLSDIRPFKLEAEIAGFEAMGEAMAAIREAAPSGEAAAGNLKELALALQMYAADNDVLPDMSSPEAVRTALADYVTDEGVFTDPDTGGPYAVNASLSGKPISGIRNLAETVAFYQTQAGEDGKRGVAFVDGHAERVREERWEKLKTNPGIG